MSIRHIKAVRRYYVVSTGYGEDDFITSGEMSPNGTIPTNTEWPAGAKITWSSKREHQQTHPALLSRSKTIASFSAKVRIDAESGIDVAATHAAKAQEARLVKFNGVTDTDQLPYIAAEIALQPEKTMLEIADEIWTEHTGVASSEATRTYNKRTWQWTWPAWWPF